MGSEARFAYPKGLTVDHAGNVYVADSFYDVRGNTIRKITPAGQVTTLAGLAGTFGNSDGAGSAARFSDPADVAVDGAGNVYVADRGNCSIRKVTPARVVSTLAGSTQSNAGYADGVGSEVRLSSPEAIEVDQAGRLYVIEGNRLRIGRSLQTPQLLNVSTRLNVGTDDHVGIGGFIVAGTGLKKVILRAIGPSLAGFGLGDRALADPTLELWDSAGHMVARNDNWMTNDQTQQSQEDEVRATTVAPSSSVESSDHRYCSSTARLHCDRSGKGKRNRTRTRGGL